MWDQRYSENGFAYGTTANDFLRAEYTRIPKGGKVLCLAEGEGRNAVFLAQQGYEVTAIDISPVGLEKAEQLAKQQHVTISTLVADLARYPLGMDKWDGIVSISAHTPIALRQKVHAQIQAALAPNGVFILEAYNEQQLEMSGIGGPPNKELLMSLTDLKSELADLELLIGKNVVRHISEGQYHQGQSAVVQLVARRAGE